MSILHLGKIMSASLSKRIGLSGLALGSAIATLFLPQLSAFAQTPEPSASDLAQVEITPGRATRSGPSYIGIGANIGLGGDTALGETGFTIYSKVGLTRNLSARPSVVLGGDDPAVLVPVTVDFPISATAEAGDVRVSAAPYVGGGVAISTGSDSLVRPLVVAGIDVPIADRVTANANVNLAFFDDTELGIRLGAGYNF
jgi:hypothetical protein